MAFTEKAAKQPLPAERDMGTKGGGGSALFRLLD